MLLLPAHDKDYQSEEEVKQAFKDNEEFLYCGPQGSTYITRVQAERDFGRGIYATVIYCNLTKVIKIVV